MGSSPTRATFTNSKQPSGGTGTHRGLYYEDGKLTKVIEAGRYKIPRRHRWLRRRPTVECMLVDVRERELTIKGQEILTADKVAIRVSILVQLRVTDPKAAIESHRDWLCQDRSSIGRTFSLIHELRQPFFTSLLESQPCVCP